MVRSPYPPEPRIRAGMVAFALLAALVAGLLAPVAAFGAEEPWEQAIRDGIADQNRQLARTSPKQIVNVLAGKIARTPNDPVTLYLLARAYGKKGDDDASAIATYGDVLKLVPNCYFAFRDRGVLAWKRKDAAAAEKDLRQAVALKPEWALALQDLAAVLVKTKRYEEATGLLSRVLDAEPANVEARIQLIQCYDALGKADDGLRTLQPLIGRDPNDPGLRLLEARMWMLKGRYAEAQDAFLKLARENPDSPFPLQAWLEAADRGKRGEAETAVWVLDRLSRLVRDEETRKKLREQADRIRTGAAQPKPPAPTGPPTLEQIAALLRAEKPEARLHVLLWLAHPPKSEPPPVLSGDALRALIERTAQKYEPVAVHRALALRVLERSGDPAIASLVRIPIGDAKEDDAVRAVAADVLAALGNIAMLGALYDAAVSPDPTDLPVSARAAAYWLMRAPAQETGTVRTRATEAAAFRAFWASPEARLAKLRAIDGVLSAADKFPWELLHPFLPDDDPEVRTKAYEALKRVASHASGDSPYALWMKRLPSLDVAALAAEDHSSASTALAAWWKERPQ